MLIAISLALLALEAPLIFKKRFETLLPSLAAAAVLVCYVLAMFRALYVFGLISAGLAAAGLLWLVIPAAHPGRSVFSRPSLALVLTPGLVCFALLIVFYFMAAVPHRVYHTDDIYEWAIQPLSLFAHNGLVGPQLHLSPRFMSYTPGMALFQWIVLTVGGEWKESAVYFGLWLMYAILLLPFAARITWKKAWLIPLFVLCAVLLPAAFNEDAYLNLRVDTVVGLCLGYAMALSWQFATQKEHRLNHAVSLALVLALLVLIKQDGIVWALVPLAFILFWRGTGRTFANRLGSTALIALPPAAVGLSWLLFCRIMGLQGQHTAALQGGFSLLFGGQLVSSADAMALLKAVWLAAFRGAFPPTLWAAVFVALPPALALCGRLRRREAFRLSLWTLFTFGCYLIGFYVVMLTAFRSSWASPVDQTAIQPLMDTIRRYGCALWYALAALTVSVVFTPPEGSPARSKLALVRRLPAAACALLVLFALPWSTLATNLLPGRYVENDVSVQLDGLAADAVWTDEIENKPDAIVLLASDSYPYNRGWLQYALAPIKIITPLQTGLNPDDFITLVRDNGVRYFVSQGSENELYALASAFTPDGELDEYTVYAVQWDGDELTLVDPEET